MTGRRAGRASRGGAAVAAARAAPGPSRAAWIALTALAALVIGLVVSIPIYDPDFWQHLLVGKVIWQARQVPRTMLWVWPLLGQPCVLPSWLFRALLWPFWAVGGLAGLYAWRVLATLAAFALLWSAARAAGARGPWALVALVWCALLYRSREQIRPETLVAVLLAAQLALLEHRRARGARAGSPDPAWGLVPLALLWANVHVSYLVGLLLTAIHGVEALVRRREPGRRPGTLFLVLLACVAASFVNPFGWRALLQPFQYFLVWRHEPIYRAITELGPLDWRMGAASLLPLWLVMLPVLAFARGRRHGADIAQWLVLLVFVPQAIGTDRLLGTLVLVVAPTFARDFDEVVGGALGRWIAAPRHQVLAAGALITLLPLPSLAMHPTLRPRFDVMWEFVPVAACDWIEAHEVRGRALNDYPWGGYLLWRFWPRRDRLPFMDVHQSGTTADRYRMAYLGSDPGAWRELDDERRFDWVLAPVVTDGRSRLLDILDADDRFALVFDDDVAALYLRRDGADSALAARAAYRWLPAGLAGVHLAGERAARDPLAARGLRSELERRIAESPWNGNAHSMLGSLDLSRGRWTEALAELRAARRVKPGLLRLAEREQLALDSLAARR